jgi:hypothetical protein
VLYIYHKDEHTNNTKLKPTSAPAFAFSEPDGPKLYTHARDWPVAHGKGGVIRGNR